MSTAHVDLYRRQDQHGHVERGIASFAHGHEAILADAFFHMDVAGTLLSHGGHVTKLTPSRQIVVAHEQPRLSGEGENALDRAIQSPSTCPREVTTGCSVIRHEQGVTDKGDSLPLNFDHVGHACRRMPWGVQGAGAQVANCKVLLVVEQHIELAAIASEAAVSIEQGAEDFLHLSNLAANCNSPSQGLLEIRRGRQMIGMYMGFENPLNRTPQLFHPRDQLVR
ncbi:hypothetical protein D3C77_502700 [compost metagenome]